MVREDFAMKKIISVIMIALFSASLMTACSNGEYENAIVEISNLNQIKSEQEMQNASLSEENEKLNNEISNLNKSQTSLQSEVSSLKKDNTSLTSQVSELKKENSDLNQKIKTAQTSKPAETSTQTSQVSETSNYGSSVQNIYIGNTVKGNGYDLTLNNVSLTYKAVPDNPPSYYTYYEAKVGKVYIKVDATIKNTSKVGISCDEIYSAKADYNNGFTYSGFCVADDYDGDFTYASITRIDPLETLGVHCLIDCPEEVNTNTSAPLSVTITLNNDEKYVYTIR